MLPYTLVEEKIDHDVPRVGGGDGPPHLQHHAGEKKVETPDAVLPLVVSGDTDVHVTHGGVGVAESDDGNVAQSRLIGRLAAHQQEQWLEQGCIYIICDNNMCIVVFFLFSVVIGKE